MVTSQIPLGLVLEQRMPLDPLPIPKNNMAHDNPAIQLFVERARRVRPAPAAGALQRVRHGAGAEGSQHARRLFRSRGLLVILEPAEGGGIDRPGCIRKGLVLGSGAK